MGVFSFLNWGRSISRSNGNVRGFGAVLIASSLMSYVPQANLGTLVFTATILAFILYSIAKYGLFVEGVRSVFALLFLFWCTASYITLNSNGYGFEEWSRAIIPFLFFLLFLFLGDLDDDGKDIVATSIIIACVVWAVRVVGEALILALQGSDVLFVRLTYRVTDAVLIFGIVAFPYLLFRGQSLNPRFRWLLLATFGYLLIWVGYRAGIALMMIPIAYFFMESFVRRNLWPVLGFLTLVTALYFSGIFTTLGLVERYDGLAAEVDGSKAAEWSYAMAQFLAAPITGMGMGWQVPGDLAYVGVDTTGIDVPRTVNYVHNSFGYMAMNLGLIGVFFYYAMVFPRPFWKNEDAIQKFSSITLLLLMLFCLTQASFRSIQTVILTVALVKLNTPSRTERKQDE